MLKIVRVFIAMMSQGWIVVGCTHVQLSLIAVVVVLVVVVVVVAHVAVVVVVVVVVDVIGVIATWRATAQSTLMSSHSVSQLAERLRRRTVEKSV